MIVSDNGEWVLCITEDVALFTLDSADIDVLGAYEWSVTAFRSNFCRYAYRRSRSDGIILLHRAIMQPASGMVVDHVNGNSVDNRRANLRIVTAQQNSSRIHHPARGATSSGYRGVYDQGNGRYTAIISLGGRRQYLGTYGDPADAARAFDAAATDARGTFTHLNFPMCS